MVVLTETTQAGLLAAGVTLLRHGSWEALPGAPERNLFTQTWNICKHALWLWGGRDITAGGGGPGNRLWLHWNQTFFRISVQTFLNWKERYNSLWRQGDQRRIGRAGQRYEFLCLTHFLYTDRRKVACSYLNLRKICVFMAEKDFPDQSWAVLDVSPFLYHVTHSYHVGPWDISLKHYWWNFESGLSLNISPGHNLNTYFRRKIAPAPILLPTLTVAFFPSIIGSGQEIGLACSWLSL